MRSTVRRPSPRARVSALACAALACAAGASGCNAVLGIEELGPDDDAGAATDAWVATADAHVGVDAADAGARDAANETDVADAAGDAARDDAAGAADAHGDAAEAGLTCDAPTTCGLAPILGSIAGDIAGPSLTTSGPTSAWVVVDVLEKDLGVIGIPMHVHATLTSPPGTNFDLYAYLASSPPPAQNCATVWRSSTNVTGTDAIDGTWGESSGLSNGTDDSARLTLEVRHVSGACVPGQTWSLVVQGD